MAINAVKNNQARQQDSDGDGGEGREVSREEMTSEQEHEYSNRVRHADIWGRDFQAEAGMVPNEPEVSCSGEPASPCGHGEGEMMTGRV